MCAPDYRRFRGWALTQLLFCAAFLVSGSIAFSQDVTVAQAQGSSDPANPTPISSEPPALNNMAADPSEPPPVELDAPSPPIVEDSKSVVTNETLDSGVSAVPHMFHYAAHVTVRAVYDDNINLTNTDRTSDYYFAIEPAITVGVGDIVGRQENYIRLDYAPSAFLFVDNSDFNAVQHLIRLEAQHRFSRLTLTLSQDVQLLEGANLNTNALATTGAVLDNAGRTRVDFYITHLNASYELSGKTFITAGLDYSVNDYHDLIGSEVAAGNIYFNYNYSPKLTIGVGGNGGYNWVDSPSPEQTFEQVNVRATYQATGKISLNASGGVEFRQFEGSSRDEHISPVYEVGATYQPFDGTTISVTGSRRTLNSAVFANQDYAATNIIFGLRQRFLQRVFLGLSVGYENTDYFATVSGVNATRNDDYFFIEPAIDFNIFRSWTVGAYYLHRQSDSSIDTFSFYDNQVGLRSAFTF